MKSHCNPRCNPHCKPHLVGVLLLPMLLLALLSPTTSHAQELVFQTSSDGEVALMEMPGGLLVVEGTTEARVVRRVASPDGHAETPDIQEEDLIIYFDGTPIKSAEQLKTLYEEAPEDKEIKLGIQRGDQKMIRTFVKKQMHGDFESEDGGVMVRNFEFNSDGSGMAALDNQNLWPAGFMVGEKNNEVIVVDALPLPNKAEALQPIQQGDAILMLNGTAVKTVDDLLAGYEAIATGDEVTLTYRQDDQKHEISFEKPEPPRMRMQIETGNSDSSTPRNPNQ